MAKTKTVRGQRANKPNDSFGTTSNKSLYRGQYRENVYKEEEETEVKQEAQQEVEQQEVEKESKSFVSEKKPEVDYKKRYDDLKRHYDEKVVEWKNSRAQEQKQIPSDQGEETDSSIQHLKEQYPDLYDAVNKITTKQSDNRVKILEKEIEGLKQKEVNLQKEKAYEELLRLQPDFDSLKTDEKFTGWL